MAKEKMRISFTFEDPNGKGVLERALERILLDRLKVQRRQLRSPRGGSD